MVAQRSLPWTMPELVAHLEDFLAQIALTEDRERHRKVMIYIDEVDRIGSADEATKFLSEIKAIFGVPHCYFVVAVAEELGLSFSRRGLNGRSVADNAFDEIISLEPMSLELSRELLTRRVPGFTEAFVRLSFVLSGGLPRDLIRVARRLAGNDNRVRLRTASGGIRRKAHPRGDPRGGNWHPQADRTAVAGPWVESGHGST